MKRLQQGSIIRFPLQANLGYAYAKFIDLLKISPQVGLPEILKIYDFKSDKPIDKPDSIKKNKFLIAPVLVAGLRPTLKHDIWTIVGRQELNDKDFIIPDFKWTNQENPNLSEDEFLIVNNCDIDRLTKVSYDEFGAIQPYSAFGTGYLEVLITMYFLIRDGKAVDDFFDLNDQFMASAFKHVTDSPLLLEP